MRRHALRLLFAVTAVSLAACRADTGNESGGPLLAYLDASGQLHLVDTNSMQEVPFQDDLRLGGPFAWSPNGQLIAASDGVDLWAARPAGSLERVTSLASGERASGVAWTRDGLQVAYAVDGPMARIDVVDRLTGQVATAYPRRADLGGWWEPTGLEAQPMLVVRDSSDGVVYLVDIEEQTRHAVARADEVLSSSGGVVRFLVDGTAFQWTASDGASPALNDVAPSQPLTALEENGVITVLDTGTGEKRSVGAGSEPALQPTGTPSEPPPQSEPRNLLRETTSFERGVEGWSLTGFNAPSAETGDEDARYGDRSARVTFGGEQSVFALDLGEARADIDQREVTFSAWVRTVEPGVHLRYLASNAEPQGGAASEAHPGDGEWHRLTLTFTPSFHVGGTTSYAIVGVRATSTGTALVDGVQLEHGARATDYEPAADDPLSALPRGEPIPPP